MANWLAWLPVSSMRRMLVTRQRCLDEPRLALVVLPHRRAHRAERGIGVDLDLLVLVALPFDPPFALLDLARQPRHVEMVQRLQPLLDIRAGAHRVGRSDLDTHAPSPEIREQPLLVGRALVILHERDLSGGNAASDELLLDPAIRRGAARRLHADRAEI